MQCLVGRHARAYVAFLGVWTLMIMGPVNGWPLEPPMGHNREKMANAEDYFPDTQGMQWRYRGEVMEGPLQTIGRNGFVNVSTVKGTDKIKGVTVKVFHDTNPGNHGPSDSYYRKDPAGIVYYGSDPGTSLEKQLIPYQIVRFPIEIPSSFQQFNREGLDFGSDIDGDEQNEKADMEAVVTVMSKESVTVPAGTIRTRYGSRRG
jgi:hypothetical protein